jgi:hypothetical protein
MSRTVHVLDPAAPGCGMALCDALAILQEDDALVILGGRDHAENVRRRRVVVDANVPMPLGIPRLASPGLGRALKTLIMESTSLDPELRPASACGPIGRPGRDPWYRSWSAGGRSDRRGLRSTALDRTVASGSGPRASDRSRNRTASRPARVATW